MRVLLSGLPRPPYSAGNRTTHYRHLRARVVVSRRFGKGLPWAVGREEGSQTRRQSDQGDRTRAATPTRGEGRSVLAEGEAEGGCRPACVSKGRAFGIWRAEGEPGSASQAFGS